MPKDSFIDLGREMDCGPCSPKSDSQKGDKKKYYPTLYITGVEGVDLEPGEIEFRAKGRVVSISKRETEEDGEKCSCEIEVHSIDYPGAKPEDDSGDTSEKSLDKSLSDIESKKSPSDDDGESDEYD
jgi:hypothetical protein